MNQLNGLLRGMHLPGRASNTFGSVTPLFVKDERRTRGVLAVWDEYEARTVGVSTMNSNPPASHRRVVWWFALIDSLAFAPLYTLAFLLFFQRSRHRAPALATRWQQVSKAALDTDKVAAVYRGFALAGIGLAALAFCADESENWLTYFTVRDGVDGAMATGLALASGVKWAAAALAVVAVLVLGLVFARAGTENSWRSFWRVIHRLRAHLVVVALFGFFVLGFAGPVADQIPDLIRRWSIVQLGTMVVLTAVFALTAWSLALWLLSLADRPPPPRPSGPVPASRLRRWLTWPLSARHRMVGTALFLLGVGQAVAWVAVWAGADFNPGWGFALPAGFVLALFWLGVALGDVGRALEEPDPATSVQLGAHGAPQVLAATVPFLLGVGVLQASFGETVYAQKWSSDAIWPAVAVVAGVLLALAARALARRAWWTEPLVYGTASAAVWAIVYASVHGAGALEPSVLVVAGLLLAAGGLRLYAVLPSATVRQTPWLFVPLGLAALVLVAMWAAIGARLYDTGATLGALGVAAVFFTLLAVAAAGAVWIADGSSPPRALLALHLRRTPIVILVVIWIAVVASKGVDYNGARLIAPPAGAQGLTLKQAFACWLAKNRLPPGTTPCPAWVEIPAATPRPRVTPLVLVSTTGGGIRAAYWTDLVLDCALERAPSTTDAQHPCDSAPEAGFRRSDSVFAASGISGGSLGLASYAAYLTEKKAGVVDESWATKRLNDDSLSASAAWWFFVEFPQAFVGFEPPRDRAAVLEEGWEREWRGAAGGGLTQGLFQLMQKHPEAPLLLLEGTSVEDGCRFNTSVLDANVELRVGQSNGGFVDRPRDCRSTIAFDNVALSAAEASAAGIATGTPPRIQVDRDRSILTATRDLADFLCGKKDVRLSTAALLSARFPIVTPPARLRRQCSESPGGVRKITSVVDGGYLDTSGASPIVELTEALRPMVAAYNADNPASCIVPYLVQIDNGFDSGARAANDAKPSELAVPLSTLGATRIARAAEARSFAALMFDRAFPGIAVEQRGKPHPLVDRYAHFVNEAHPGPSAPLGWTQSETSMDELVLQRLAPQNLAALRELRLLFSLTRPNLQATSQRLRCT